MPRKEFSFIQFLVNLSPVLAGFLAVRWRFAADDPLYIYVLLAYWSSGYIESLLNGALAHRDASAAVQRHATVGGVALAGALVFALIPASASPGWTWFWMGLVSVAVTNANCDGFPSTTEVSDV